MPGTFSIAMCTYNGSLFLEAQLESIRNQTRLPEELVICDDGSSDNTVSIVEHFAAKAPFSVQLEINNDNLGSIKNFEKAISMCAGEFIALADQDDVWLPHKLQTIGELFQVNPNVGLVFSDAEIVDEELTPVGYNLWASIGFDRNLQDQFRSGRAFDILLPGCVVTGATMAFRSRFRALALPLPDDIPVIHDGWIATLTAAVADVSFINQPLIKYRIHEQQQIGVPKISQKTTKDTTVPQSMRRTNNYSHVILVGERVQSRLAECLDAFDTTKVLRGLDARITHLRNRDEMQHGRVGRLPSVLRELVTGRYHLYSSGFYSALKDLLS